MSRERRLWAGASVVVLALVLSPLARGRDGFPLSNYPMFSRARDTEVRLAHVVGVTADGRSRPMPPRMLGTDEIMQAAQTATAAAKKPERAEELCRRVAAEVLRAGEPFADIVALEVRTDVYDSIRYWNGERAPLRGTLHVGCQVAR